jgi:hypothetical protein
VIRSRGSAADLAKSMIFPEAGRGPAERECPRTACPWKDISAKRGRRRVPNRASAPLLTVQEYR